MLKKYKEKQPFFYSFVTKELDGNKNFHSFLLETKNLTYGNELAIDLAKYIFSFDQNLEENYVDLIDNSNFPDLFIINTNKSNIKKEEIKNLQLEFSNKPVFSKYKIYIINDIEYLNNYSANALLKFLEEPNENIIAILTCKNVSNIIDTIVSRCQTISLVDDIKTKNFENYDLSKIINFFIELETKQTDFLINRDIYLIKEQLNDYLFVGLYLYYDVLNAFLERNYKIIDGFFEEKNKIRSFNSKDDIIKKIILINEYLNKLKLNLNKDIFLDNFIIDMGGIND